MTAGPEESSSMVRGGVRLFGKRRNNLMMNSKAAGREESLKREDIS